MMIPGLVFVYRRLHPRLWAGAGLPPPVLHQALEAFRTGEDVAVAGELSLGHEAAVDGHGGLLTVPRR